MIRTLLAAWILLLHWTYSAAWPRPYDDWKNTVFYLGAGVLGLFSVFRQRGSFSKSTKPVFWVGLYLAACLISIQLPFYEGTLALARLLLWVGLISFLIKIGRDDLLSLGGLSLFSASLIAALTWAVYWMQYHELSFFHFTTAYTANFIPPVGHISYFGDFMGLHIPLAVWFLVGGEKRWQKKLGALSFTLLLGGAWLSGTRATLFAIFISVLFALLLFLKSKVLSLRQAALLFVAFLALLAGLALFQPSGFRTQPVLTRVTETFQADRPGKQTTVLEGKAPAELIMGTRTLALYQSFKMFLERPLRGWGVGSFRFVYPPFSQFPRP
ncbi:MAG: hypothetical protein HY539_02215, partial [Deltaproteobacteria bacterium]|nr:hypothetical protein [Deltaproteobacteria bacterium]